MVVAISKSVMGRMEKKKMGVILKKNINNIPSVSIKEKSLRRKNSTKARGDKMDEPSRNQGSGGNLQGGADTDDAVREAVMEADTESARVEETDHREVAVRGHLFGAGPPAAIEVDAVLFEVGEVLGDLGVGSRDLVFRREHLRLPIGRPPRGIGDDLREHEIPSKLAGHVIDEFLVRVPMCVA